MPGDVQVMTSKELVNAYKAAGEKFVRFRLMDYIIMEVTSEETRIIHNNAVKELAILLGNTENIDRFIKNMCTKLFA